MRLRFWQRRNHWRNGNDWQARRHDGVVRDLDVRVGDTKLTIRLTIDISDVELVFRPFSSMGWSDHYFSWELAAIPEANALTSWIAEGLRVNDCHEPDIECIVRLVQGELVRLVDIARKERDRRLSNLPPPADVHWNDIHLVDDGWSAERHGVYDDSGGTINLRLSYALVMRLGGHCAYFSVESRRPGRVPQRTNGVLPLDGICHEGVIQMLEIWGWPGTVPASVGRAAAVQARTDWIALLPQREAAKAREDEFWQLPQGGRKMPWHAPRVRN